MKTNQLKIKNASRRITVILKIGGIISIFITIMALAAICILTLSGEEMKSSFISAFNVTANNGTTISIASQSLLFMFSFMLVDTILITILIFLVHAIFSNIEKECTPFVRENAMRIKKIAIITFILSVVGSYSDALVDYYTIGELTWRANITGLIISMIIYSISLIFDYGCDLQQEVDETL